MPESVLQRSFAGGELSPALAARADLAKYATGLKTCRNFIVQRHGGVANRAGTRFINATKADSSVNKKLLRYVHETPGESILIEAGESYLRFYQHGALVTVGTSTFDDWDGGTDYVIGDSVKSGGVGYYCVKDHTNHAPPNVTYWHPFPADGSNSIYELPTPFSGATDLFNWSQSGRVITLTRRDVAPHELIFVAIDRWVIRVVTTTPQVTPPENPALVNTSGARKFGYVITAASPITYEESEPSAQVIDLSAAAPTPDAPHELSWDAVLIPPVTGTACPEYYVYCDPYGNGTYGFVGTATGAATFKNPGIDPDFNLTPPLPRPLFDATGLYPHVSATYQQRRFFAQTVDVPDGVYASRLGFPSNFGITSPLQDDDAITFRIAGNDQHPVRHLVGLKSGLVLLTDGGAWVAVGQQGRTMVPNGIQNDQDTYEGAAGDVRPATVGNGVIYLQARGSIVREVKFDIQVEGLAGKDLTVFAGHLFDGFDIVALDYAATPHSIVWCVRGDGTLLGLTYVAEQDVWGWHRHDTAGAFEDVCVVPEPLADAVYLIVKRTIGGSDVRYIEKLEKRTIIDFNLDSFFVDAGLTYDGASVDTVSGLDHLEGRSVVALVDGVPQGPFTVSGGAVTLSPGGSTIHVGLPIAFGDIETLDLDVSGAAVRDKKKDVKGVTLLLEKSSRTCLVGPDVDHLTKFKPASYDPVGKSFTGSIELNVIGAFDASGRVFIRQTDPLPLTVLGVIPNLEVGG